jgi:hypothetical protein
LQPSIVNGNAQLLYELGLEDNVGLTVSDTPQSYKQLAEAVRSRKFDGVFIGYGVRGNPEWFEKVSRRRASAERLC